MMIVACFMNLAKTASRKRDTAMLLECAAAVSTLFEGNSDGATSLEHGQCAAAPQPTS